MMMSLTQMAAALSAEGISCRVRGDGAAAIDSVSIDSRTLAPGALYVALHGERFDGHDYCAAAQERGALALLVERVLPLPLPQLLVPDAYAALAGLAAHWRKRFPIPVIAVTGSNGKTTTTQMIAAILAQAFGAQAGVPQWLATRGNLNNHIGVPLMLLRLRGEHRAAVLELGMNHPGEIARLSGWVRPGVSLVTNAQREHQEFLDSVEATARENGAAIQALGAGGAACFPADDACAPVWRALAGNRRIVDFSFGPGAAVHADVRCDAHGAALHVHAPAGEFDLALPVGGEHNARNALAAASAALAIGVAPAAIAAGLRAFRPVGGRGTRHALAGGAQLIDDSYNANPDSVRAAIDLLASCAAPRVLVFGDMGEVGTRGAEFHQEIGAYARQRGIEHLLAIGQQARVAVQAFGAAGRHFPAIDELIVATGALLAGGGTVLVKGSRFMRLERVVQALAPGQQPEPAMQGKPPIHA